ncbi:hypothetical protein OAF34_01380 [Pirellulaceae bacterium]|nr:hypothetical protein [Pirellulaceae bacterium]
MSPNNLSLMLFPCRFIAEQTAEEASSSLHYDMSRSFGNHAMNQAWLQSTKIVDRSAFNYFANLSPGVEGASDIQFLKTRETCLDFRCWMGTLIISTSMKEHH